MSICPPRPLLLGLTLLAFCLAGTATASEKSGKGAELFNSLGCKGCHSLAGSGGSLGPALDKVGQSLSEKQIHEKLVNPKGSNPNSIMPAYAHLSEADLKALVEFLEEHK